MDFNYLCKTFLIILPGAKYTLLVFFITIILSLFLGIILMFCRNSKLKILASFSGIYVWIMRGTPLLLQLFFFCYGITFIPVIGEKVVIDRFVVACLTFILNYSAYFCEIFRGGYLSIDKGQHEASKVMGFSKMQINLYIIFPQMLKVTLPSIGNECINLVKDTALITAIGITELLYFAKATVNRDVNPTAFFAVAIIYLIMTYGLEFIFKKLEKRFEF